MPSDKRAHEIFSVDYYLQRFSDKKDDICACGCLRKVKLDEVSELARALDLFFPPGLQISVQKQLHKTYVLSLASVSRRHCKDEDKVFYYLPCISCRLCFKAFAFLSFMKERTLYVEISKSTTGSVEVVCAKVHGLSGLPSNHSRKNDREFAKNVILELAEIHGQPLPTIDARSENPDSVEYEVIWMPPPI
jgi:hypothetical protein